MCFRRYVDPYGLVPHSATPSRLSYDKISRAMAIRREYNLDLLRIVAMLMIVVLHFYGKGGLLFTPDLTSKHLISWVLEGIAIVAVNCYVLISGYFLVTSKNFRISKVLGLVVQVLFYSATIYLLLLATSKVAFNPTDLVTVFLPTLTGQYWFISAYVGLYLLSPFLNKLIQSMTRRQHRILCLTLVGLFSIWPTLFWQQGGGYMIERGYSVVWFIVLYVIAAYLRLHYKPSMNIKRWILRYGLVTIWLPVVGLVTSFLTAATHDPMIYQWRDTLFMYNSVLVLAASVALFLLFINLRVKNPHVNWAIKFFAPLTLGVYLLHEHPMVRGWLWQGVQTTESHGLKFAVLAVVMIGGVYLAGSLVELLRQKLFKFITTTRAFQKSYNFTTRFLKEKLAALHL